MVRVYFWYSLDISILHMGITMKPELNQLLTRLHKIEQYLYDAINQLESMTLTGDQLVEAKKVLDQINAAELMMAQVMDSNIWD